MYNLRHTINIKELNEKRGIIYKITNTLTNKVYVGKSLYSFNERYLKFKNATVFTTHNNALQEDIYDYGITNFIIELLEKDIFDEELLLELEKFYISQFEHNSYNIDHNKNNKRNRKVNTEPKIINLVDNKTFTTLQSCVDFYGINKNTILKFLRKKKYVLKYNLDLIYVSELEQRKKEKKKIIVVNSEKISEMLNVKNIKMIEQRKSLEKRLNEIDCKLIEKVKVGRRCMYKIEVLE